MNLTFHTVTIQNFMAVGDLPITIELDQPGITAIVGKNGSGKSSLTIEAIGFALFNKSFRGMTKATLVNTTNRKGALVQVCLTANDRKVVVKRGIKPDVFTIEVDGQELDQTKSTDFQQTLEKIIGFDFGTFIRTTALGNANYMPFMAMKTAARRDFVEAILDLGIFTDLNKHVKAELATANERLAKANADLASKRAVLAERTRANAKALADNSGAIQEAKNSLRELVAAIKEWDAKIAKIKDDLVPRLLLKPKLQEQATAYWKDVAAGDGEVRALIAQRAEAEKSAKFFAQTDRCPLCETDLDHDHKTYGKEVYGKTVADLTSKILSIGADTAQKKVKIERLETAIESICQLEASQSDAFERRTSLLNQAKLLQTKIEGLQKAIEPVDLTSAEKDVADAIRVYEEATRSVETYKESLELLKDGAVKAKLIEDAIPLLNKTVNECLEAMSIGIRLEFNSEFEETLVGRYADEFLYVSLSQGERARLNLAVMFAWQQVQQIVSGVRPNLLVIDEVGFADLDEEGIDAMFEILRKLWGDQSVFIICHVPYAWAHCDRSINVAKVGGFTKIV